MPPVLLTGRHLPPSHELPHRGGSLAATKPYLHHIARSVTDGACVVEAGTEVLSRRTFLKTIGLGALGVFGLVVLCLCHRAALPPGGHALPPAARRTGRRPEAAAHGGDRRHPCLRSVDAACRGYPRSSRSPTSLAARRHAAPRRLCAGPAPLPHLGRAAAEWGRVLADLVRAARRLWRHRQSRLVARYRRRAPRLRRQPSSADGKRRGAPGAEGRAGRLADRPRRPARPSARARAISAASTICRERWPASPRTARRSC